MDREGLLRTLRWQGIRDERVLTAIAAVPRDEFAPPEHRSAAWGNHPLPIGAGQTMSQPYVVAYMIESLELVPGDRVLDIGTGCGYQAAVLAACGADVVSVEVRRSLAEAAAERLQRLGYGVEVHVSDGNQGWPAGAPYDAIVAAAAAPIVPPALWEQLREPRGTQRGGRLILPLAEADDYPRGGRLGGPPVPQRLVLFERIGPAHADGARTPAVPLGSGGQESQPPDQAAGRADTESARHPQRYRCATPPGFRRTDLLEVAFVPMVDSEATGQ